MKFLTGTGTCLTRSLSLAKQPSIIIFITTHIHIQSNKTLMMASSMVFQTPSSTSAISPPPLLLHKSNFRGETHHLLTRQSFQLIRNSPQKMRCTPTPTPIVAKFNLFEIMGGRGLCNGEEGLQQLLNKPTTTEAEDTTAVPVTPPTETETETTDTTSVAFAVGENAFEKELSGFTGGFPGGEKGLQTFIDKYPPPPPKPKINKSSTDSAMIPNSTSLSKPQPPQLPLLMPGMIAIVKNPNHPFYMYTGIIQRITDGKAGVLFEGGNWDKLITFRLDELQRREKGPPMVNPKSAVLEPLVDQTKE